MINIIVAIDNNGAIGRGGDLLYHLREDMRHFRTLTTGNTVVMGRRTFESLPKGALPDRRNIVITRRKDYTAPGIETAQGIAEALEMAAGGPGETFIIGGAEIYSAMLGHADRLYLTLVDASATDADTFFPPVDPETWHIAGQSEPQTDPKTGLKFTFVELNRRTDAL